MVLRPRRRARRLLAVLVLALAGAAWLVVGRGRGEGDGGRITGALALTGTGVAEVTTAALEAFLAADPPRPGELVATFFATGVGDATLLELPSGAAVLVDAGVGWHADRIVGYLRARGRGRLDQVVLTHPHVDHYGGLEAVVPTVPVGELVWNGRGADAPRFRALEAALDARHVPRRAVRRGDRLSAGSGGVELEVLYPDADALLRCADEGENAGSIVLRVTHGAVRLLLTGDAELPEEAALLALEGAAGLRADVLKLGHHASRRSNGRAFLEAVRPRVAIAEGTGCIDVPLVYRRPTPAIRRDLEAVGAALLEPDALGLVQVVSDGRTARWRALAR